ncbi:MAG: cell wall metabolism sensor histidine kinase WalK [Clostridia bacterium]|nr:cell wall metabolism sensor histidine kinase WalK [Clostridia bacterium]
MTKKVISPITRLINNAKKIASGEEFETKELEQSRNENEVDELVNAFYMMTKELKGNLSEVSKKKNQIETILLHMTDGIIAFNMDGKIELINPAATRLLRLIPEDDSFEKIFEKLKVDINLEKIIYLENWTASEEKVAVGDTHMHMHFAPLKNEEDIPTGVIVVIQDITEHVRLSNMRKEFVADVSHELKTPITSIMGYADTLLEDEYDKETKDKFLNVIATEARRMAKLVTDLLALSRYDNDEMKQRKVEFDLGELVKQCQEKVQLEIEKKHQTVECFVTANVPQVFADKDGIERVVLNILTNSIKYTPASGNIKIYVGFVYNDAYIKIIDNGIGIPEEDLTRIFERFYRVDKARTREMGGTGLGLSIAKEILDKNEGSIDIKSKKGEGTEVVIKVPTKK